MSVLTKSVLTALLGLIGAASLAPVASAQQIFRIVGPDGKVTFSDKAPDSPEAKVVPTNAAPGGAANTGPSLPFTLRQVVGKYPVVLYTGDNCAPCAAARSYLASRGVPLVEKTITAQVDIEALQRLSGATTLPFLTIGGQQLKGFAETEWSQYLDAAGYPKTSQLPAGYKNPVAGPLVAVQKKAPEPAVARAPEETPATAATAPAAPTEPPPSNPAGIRF